MRCAPSISLLSPALPLLFVVPLLFSCKQSENRETLARRSCSACHLFPDPSLLDKKTWKTGVLPQMSLRMGLDISRLPGASPAELAEILKALPPDPMVSADDWEAICEYYEREAPDSLPAVKQDDPSPLNGFMAVPVALPIGNHNLLTMIRRDPLTGKIYVATRHAGLYRLGAGLEPEDSFHMPSPPSDIVFRQEAAPLVSCMGIMDPNDLPAGAVAQAGKIPLTIIDSLKRPVDLEEADIDSDGTPDLVVSAFGNFTGGLYVYEARNGAYTRHTVHTFPGTRKTIVRDMNGDGLPDILALMAQGDEQIALFTNRGNFRFSYSILLKFPPVYGSSYFELADFDGDGRDDILYTNGDNADYSPILKPYHGIRIFGNDGHNHFSQRWFFHLDGASMARAADFDEDGDLDIAAISFFPDFKKHPECGFVYLENRGGKFAPFATPAGASARWITMETGDFDYDGDEDIMLGALAFSRGVPDSLYASWGKTRLSGLVLKNMRDR